MAEAGPLEQLGAIVAERGWRLAWQTSQWKLVGMRLRAVQVFDTTGWLVGCASCTIGRDGTVERASVSCARMLLGT